MAYTLSGNPKLGFKLGTQSALDTLLASGTGAVHGTFYLTNDTHRLYIGNDDGTLSAVNEGIVTVQAIADLPSSPTASEVGQFYYVTGTTQNPINILCVYNGRDWIQINSVTKVEAFDNTVTVASNVGTFTNRVHQTGDSNPNGLESTTSIKGTDGISITLNNDTATTIGGTTTYHGITLTGNVASAEAVADGTNPKRAIISVENSNSNSSSEIGIIAGTGMSLSVDDTTDDITLTSDDTKVNTVTVTDKTGGGFNVNVTDTSGATKTGGYDPVIVYGSTGASSAHFVNGSATLSVYTKTEVDDVLDAALKEFNSMTYKGTVSGDNLPTSNVSIGDTYILSTAYTTGGHTYPAGSMVVASGTNTEGSDGYITGTIAWDFVDSAGNDTTYTWSNSAVTHGIRVTASTGGTAGQFGLTAGTGITLTDTDTGTNTKSVAIAHDDVTRTNTTGSDLVNSQVGLTTFNVVTSVVSNDQGHITEVVTSPLKLTWTPSTLDNDNISSTKTSSNGVQTATITTTHTIRHANNSTDTSTGNFALTSETLEITSTNTAASGSTPATTAVGLNLIWGSF